MTSSRGSSRAFVSRPRCCCRLPLLYGALQLLLFCQLCSAVYFESHPQCGFSSEEFLQFNDSAGFKGLQSLGVCDWGFDLLAPRSPFTDGTVGKCLQCVFTPKQQTFCPDGFYRPTIDPEWELTPSSSCQWTSGCLDLPCPEGTTQDGEPAVCPAGGRARKCCSKSLFRMCCKALSCTERAAPVGNCAVLDKDLLPGQVVSTPVYAVAVATGQCSSYVFSHARTCRTNRTFEPGPYYDSCQSSSPPSWDVNGCPQLPGYRFIAESYMSLQQEAIFDDGTLWGSLSNPDRVRQIAGSDLVLMAGRCDRSQSCTAFDTTGRVDLRSYLPTQDRWSFTAPNRVGQASPGTCQGTYVKYPPSAESCPRVPGYLFKPMSTLAPLSALPMCETCWNATALAAQCSSDSSCSGFSNYHGLLHGAFPAPALRTQFTTTPCMGLYERIDGSLPSEVEALDKLLCGTDGYCSSPLEYSATASVTGSAVAITVHFLASFQVPPWLSAPDSETAPSLPVLTTVSSLTLICANGSRMLGSLPRPLFKVLPNLQELQLSGCGIQGPLPPEWSLMSSLRVLDVSDNALTGLLPQDWSALRLGYLNLSRNQLTGQLPDSWRQLLSPSSSGMPVTGGGRQDSLVADLSYNYLAGPLARGYVQGACLWKELRIGFRAAGGSAAESAFMAEATQQGSPVWALYGNLGVQLWAGDYMYAVGKSSYSGEDPADNMCGSYQYIIAISVLWGTFCFGLLGVVAWWLLRRRQALRAAARQQQQLKLEEDAVQPAVTPLSDNGSSSSEEQQEQEPAHQQQAAEGEADAAAGQQQQQQAPGQEQAHQVADKRSSSPSWFDKWWQQVWVRRAVFLVRFTWLMVDLSLDVTVMVWLYQDGANAEAKACLAFILLAQAAVAIVAFVNLVPMLFSSVLLLLLASPLVLGVMPVLAPALALLNVLNPNVPMVFWRYMELLEFCVMLLEAPAMSITQTIIYARQNQVAKGMYLAHALFLASIVFSLGDMLISIFKLMRYKYGPWRRIIVAVTHLDQNRDTTPYRTDLNYYSGFRPEGPPLWGAGSHERDEPLLGADAGGMPAPGAGLNSMPVMRMGSAASAASTAWAATTNPLLQQLQTHLQRAGSSISIPPSPTGGAPRIALTMARGERSVGLSTAPSMTHSEPQQQHMAATPLAVDRTANSFNVLEDGSETLTGAAGKHEAAVGLGGSSVYSPGAGGGSGSALSTPRYRPSLLQQSALRLSGLGSLTTAPPSTSTPPSVAYPPIPAAEALMARRASTSILLGSPRGPGSAAGPSRLSGVISAIGSGTITPSSSVPLTAMTPFDGAATPMQTRSLQRSFDLAAGPAGSGSASPLYVRDSLDRQDSFGGGQLLSPHASEVVAGMLRKVSVVGPAPRPASASAASGSSQQADSARLQGRQRPASAAAPPPSSPFSSITAASLVMRRPGSASASKGGTEEITPAPGAVARTLSLQSSGSVGAGSSSSSSSTPGGLPQTGRLQSSTSGSLPRPGSASTGSRPAPAGSDASSSSLPPFLAGSLPLPSPLPTPPAHTSGHAQSSPRGGMMRLSGAASGGSVSSSVAGSGPSSSGSSSRFAPIPETTGQRHKG